MSISVDVVSIGCLSRNRFWNESRATRSAHATTTLIRTGKTTILVDPSLPAPALAARLDERSGLKPERIDMVFLTTFRPVHRRGLSLFPRAEWVMFGDEIQAVTDHLQALAAQAREAHVSSDPLLEDELTIVGRFRPAPDKLASGVDLFPTPGVTPGACALLVIFPDRTVAVAGDAVISKDYFLGARVYEQSVDAESAKRSFAEVVEIADVIIPGHDNVILR